MNKAYLLLGSNKGDRKLFLDQAKNYLLAETGEILNTSSIYSTAPWGKKDQANFLNQVIELDTLLNAETLLAKILNIEKKLGRTRTKKWDSRTIDIDILFFNSEILNSESLTVPHPFLHERKFALIPLAQIAENFIHPTIEKSIKNLLLACKDELEVNILPEQ